MKEYDFIFVYETKNRELESICLLKTELERRGYSVKLVETWWTLHHIYEPVKANVMITFALYDNSQIKFTLSFAKGVKRIINMQWEQIYANNNINNPNSSYVIRENAKEHIHISWGENNYKWLSENCGVGKENIVRAGHIASDFVKPAFSSYYKSRKELFKEFRLDTKKTVILFLSSFSYVGLPEKIISQDIYQNAGSSPEVFQAISVMSQRKIIDWVKNVMPKHKDCIFVYRPHPAEVGNNELLKLENSLTNFRVINKYSVKQWIKCSDRIYSWFSTAAADAFFCGKPVQILRPLKIPYDMEVTLYNGATFITEETEFEKSLTSKAASSISNEVFKEYFYYDENVYSFKTISDACERELKKVLETEKEKTPDIKPPKRKFYQIGFHAAVRNIKKGFVKIIPEHFSAFYKRFLIFLYQKPCFRGLCKKRLPDFDFEYNTFVRKMIKNNYASASEIKRIQKKIKRLIDSI